MAKYTLYKKYNKVVGLGVYSESRPTLNSDVQIEIPIEFKSEGICKNNWGEIKDYINNNLEYSIKW